MSTALIESSTETASQLFFAWSEVAEPVANPQPLRRFSKPTIPSPSSYVAERAEDGISGDLEYQASNQTPAVAVHQGTSAFPVMGGGEVRLGAVMIKLLKSYGITDAEIAEGIASYAQKRCHSVAS